MIYYKLLILIFISKSIFWRTNIILTNRYPQTIQYNGVLFTKIKSRHQIKVKVKKSFLSCDLL